MGIAFLSNYFFLSEKKALVNGAKNSIIIDLKASKIYRVNSSARRIIELGEQGSKVAEVAKKQCFDLDGEDVYSFIKEIADLGLIRISARPKTSSPKEDRLPKLDFLWIEVSSRCNLRCVHCYAESKAGAEDEAEQPNDLSNEEIRKVIDEAAALGCRRLQLTGGEPMLRSDIKSLVEYAKTKGFEFIEVFTNGTLLTEPVVKFFADKGVNVAMSIYSYRGDTHDAITRVHGSFGRTLNSLKLLLAYKVPTRCAIVAMKQNEDDLNGTSYFLSKLGVLFRPPDPIRPSGRGTNLKNWPQTYGQLFMQTQPSFLTSEEAYERNSQWNSCWLGKATVTSCGNVMPCVFARDLVVGNIKQQGMAEIIEGPAMLSYWGLTRDQVEVCKDCEFRYVCEDCRPWAYGFTGNLYAKSPRCTYDPYTGKWAGATEAKSQASECVGTPTLK
ncbi:MAG: radical SAM protein [Candidatus Bathyarchaeota archaeon]|nr:MAG: radical SAM protein [Candidatus Bathyarchaeota archaeon]